MIVEKTTSLFDSDATVFVNTVNCVGVMGKGIALEFKKRFPKNFLAYRDWCERGSAAPGTVFDFCNGFAPRFIFNVATKNHWKSPSRLEWVGTGITRIRTLAIRHGATSIALQALGCSNGGLHWDEVRPLIVDCFGDSPIRVEVYLPGIITE